MIHQTSDVQSATVGENTSIWQYCVVLPDARIGDDCNICSHVFIENDVVVGDRVTIKNGVQLWDGLRIEDDVFIGPNVTFTNDKYPRSKQYPDAFMKTLVMKNASIGANATILPGISIGENAIVGAGAVVTTNVPNNAIVMGVPARVVRYNNSSGKQGHDADSQNSRMLSGPILYSLHDIKDILRKLVVGEYGNELPFIPKRIFKIYDTPNSNKVRCAYAHRECHQFLIAIRGSINVILDDGDTREEYQLSNASLGLHIKPGVWGVQHNYSKDAVLLILASHKYNASDCIDSYTNFIEWKKMVPTDGESAPSSSVRKVG